MSDEKKKAPDATYVVQGWCPPATEEQRKAADLPEPAKGFTLPSTWMDLATVTVPGGTNRKTVLKQALAESNLQPNKDGSPPRLRVLDADSAFVHEPEAVQPPMEWRL